MKRFLSFVVLATLAVAPSAAQSASTPMSASAIGVGPHGYDFLIGSWACTNDAPSAVAGPASSTITVTKSAAGGALFYRVTGKDFDAATYLTYSPKTKTWWGPTAYADGGYEIESTTDTGPKAVWAGSLVSGGSSKAIPWRDNYTMSSSKLVDVGQSKATGSWKTQYTVTCTKS